MVPEGVKQIEGIPYDVLLKKIILDIKCIASVYFSVAVINNVRMGWKKPYSPD